MPEPIRQRNEGVRAAAVGWMHTLFFVVLFSGPPKFRFREGDSSVYGEIDFAIILQLVVWGLAGLFVAYQLREMITGRRRPLLLSGVHKVAIALIALLWIGIFTSVAPAFTAAKVIQITIEFLFCSMFVQRFGIEATLKRIYAASCLLCAAIVATLFIAPDLVLFATETDSLRLRGSGITETNVVSAFGLILFLCLNRRPRFLRDALLLLFFVSLLLASLTRGAWIAVGLIFLMAVVRKPALPGMKWIYFSVTAVVVAIIAGGLEYLGRFRDPGEIWTLSARVGLWEYLTDNLLSRSPWIGLGYAAGTRVIGTEFNPDLGSGHSIYFDVFIGSGILGIAVFLCLMGLLSYLAFKCFLMSADRLSFAVCSLFVFILLFGLIGAEIDTSPFGFTFWCLVSMLPMIYERGLASSPARDAAKVRNSTYMNERKANAIS